MHNFRTGRRGGQSEWPVVTVFVAGPSLWTMTFLTPPARFRPEAEKDADSRDDSVAAAGVHWQRCGSEVSLAIRPLPGEGTAHLFGRVAVAAEQLGASILQMLVFGAVAEWETGTSAMRRYFGRLDWPVTWIEGAPGNGGRIAGVHVFGWTGGRVKRVRLGSRVVGTVFRDGEIRHCVLGGLGPVQPAASRTVQARETLEQLDRALELAGFALADTVRTWFFLDDILAWYDRFNAVRTQMYSGVSFRSGSLPASTGVGGRNPGGDALSLSAWAVQAPGRASCAEGIVSPLQCPAPAYGSAFSRAMELSSASGRRLFVSGTASISPDGRTLWGGDAPRQVETTMEVVEEILRLRDFSFSDVVRATAYFKSGFDLRAFTSWGEARMRSLFPVVAAACDICREDLLFELEVEAWRPGSKLKKAAC